MATGLETALDDFGKHIGDFEFGGAHLLRDEGGGGHAGRGVDLKQVDLLLSSLTRKDVVDRE